MLVGLLTSLLMCVGCLTRVRKQNNVITRIGLRKLNDATLLKYKLNAAAFLYSPNREVLDPKEICKYFAVFCIDIDYQT